MAKAMGSRRIALAWLCCAAVCAAHIRAHAADGDLGRAHHRAARPQWGPLGLRGRLRGGGPAVAVATWDFGQIAVREAAAHLQLGKSAVDAAEAGVRAVELDTQDQYYVGYGGLPNSDGSMEMDAAIMDGGAGVTTGRSADLAGGAGDNQIRLGAVCALPDQRSAVTVARKVMDESPHNVLVGQGALAFAQHHGLQREDSLAPAARRQHEQWRQQLCADSETQHTAPHDTVGLICLDRSGRISAATSTSGWPYKHPGRVGDAPLVGSGLYADSRVGAAVATGDGEEIMRSCLSFLVVERMRLGDSPQQACELAVARLRLASAQPVPCDAKKGAAVAVDDEAARMLRGAQAKFHKDLTVGIVALSVSGEVGISSTLGPHNVHRGGESFPCAVWREDDGGAGEVSRDLIVTRLLGAEKTGKIRSALSQGLSFNHF